MRDQGNFPRDRMAALIVVRRQKKALNLVGSVQRADHSNFVLEKQARQESNLQPPVLETGALPIELRTYTLSPNPIEGWLTGIEPATPGTTIRCSNQLSYSHHVGSATEPELLILTLCVPPSNRCR